MVIDKIKKINKVQKRVKNEKASDMLIGKWIKCDNCKEILYKEEVHNNFSVCPNCGKHFRISARRRIKQIIDEGSFEEIGENLETADPLNFEGYLKKAEMLKQKTKIDEAVKCGTGKINGKEVQFDLSMNQNGTAVFTNKKTTDRELTDTGFVRNVIIP